MKILFKGFLLILICVFTAKNSFCQNVKDSSITHFEIGASIPFFLIFAKKPIYGLPQSIFFKIERNKNVFRSMAFSFLDFRNLDVNKSHNYWLNAGYERRFFNTKFQLFAGAAFNYAKTYYNYNPTSTIGNKYITHHYGVGPVVGYVYSPLKNLQIQGEIGIYYGPNKRIMSGSTENTMGFSASVNLINIFYRF